MTSPINIICREDLFEDLLLYLEVGKVKHHLTMLKNLVSNLTAFDSDSFTHLRRCQIDVTLTVKCH